MIGTMTYYTQSQSRASAMRLLHYVEGGVYPKVPPIVNQYKRTGDLMPAMTKFARIAPAGLRAIAAQVSGATFGQSLQRAVQSAPGSAPYPRTERRDVPNRGRGFPDIRRSRLPSHRRHRRRRRQPAGGRNRSVVSAQLSRVPDCEARDQGRDLSRSAEGRVAPAGCVGRSVKDAVVEAGGAGRPSGRCAARGARSGRRVAGAGGRSRDRAPGACSRDAGVAGGARVGRVCAGQNRDERRREAVRAALRDADFQVRTAAARMAGMAKDREAVPTLMDMVQRDEPAPRRQAATALGQIGDPQSVPALLRAAANPVDRFLEHAIIYSLILLRTSEPVTAALKDGNAAARKSALIALDQMDGSPLHREQIAAPLRDPDPELRRTALWVVSRHADWSGEVVQFIQTRLARDDFAPGEGEAVQQTLVSFCRGAEVQSMIASLLGNRSATSRQQLFLLDIIDRCATPEFPASWKAALRERLSASDSAVRARSAGAGPHTPDQRA